MFNEQQICDQLDKTVAVTYLGKEYHVVGYSVDYDEPDMACVYVISGYGDPNNGMWAEHPIFVDDLVNDSNLKLYTAREIPLGD